MSHLSRSPSGGAFIGTFPVPPHATLAKRSMLMQIRAGTSIFTLLWPCQNGLERWTLACDTFPPRHETARWRALLEKKHDKKRKANYHKVSRSPTSLYLLLSSYVISLEATRALFSSRNFSAVSPQTSAPKLWRKFNWTAEPTAVRASRGSVLDFLSLGEEVRKNS